MKERGKRFLALFLAVLLVIGLIPTGKRNKVQAAEVPDEYGHVAEVPDSFNANDGKNPYGSHPVNFNPMSELEVKLSANDYHTDRLYSLSKSSGSVLHDRWFNATAGNVRQDRDDANFMNSFNSDKRASKNTDYLSCGDGPDNLLHVGGNTLDAEGDEGNGRKNYTAYIGYEKAEEGYLPTIVSHKNSLGDSTGYIRTPISTQAANYKYIGDVDQAWSSDGYNSVAAGDFDNDGKETIVIYDPAKGSLALREYSISTSGAVQVSNGEYFIGTDTIFKDYYGYLLNTIQKDNPEGVKESSVHCNTPFIYMTAANVDADDSDELIVTVSLSDMAYGYESSIKDRSSVFLLWIRPTRDG